MSQSHMSAFKELTEKLGIGTAALTMVVGTVARRFRREEWIVVRELTRAADVLAGELKAEASPLTMLQQLKDEWAITVAAMRTDADRLESFDLCVTKAELTRAQAGVLEACQEALERILRDWPAPLPANGGQS